MAMGFKASSGSVCIHYLLTVCGLWPAVKGQMWRTKDSLWEKIDWLNTNSPCAARRALWVAAFCSAITVWPDGVRHVTWERRPLLSVRTIVSASETTTGSSQGDTDDQHDEWQPGLEVMLWCQLSSSPSDMQLSGPHSWQGNGVIEKKKKLPWCSRLPCFEPKCSIRGNGTAKRAGCGVGEHGGITCNAGIDVQSVIKKKKNHVSGGKNHNFEASE